MSVLAVVEGESSLPMEPLWFGIIALIFFGALLAITWAFRGAAHRHDPRAYSPSHDHAGSHGADDHGSGGH